MDKVCIIDFDGVICENNYPDFGEPTKGVKDGIYSLKEKGFYIKILSCRTSSEIHKYSIDRLEEVRKMEEYLKKHEIPYDEVLNIEKPVASYYIDDRAIRFEGDWNKILEKIV